MTSKIKNRTPGLFTAQGYLSLTYKNVQQCLKILKSWSPVSCVLPPLPTLLAPLSQTHGDFYLHLLNTSRTVIN